MIGAVAKACEDGCPDEVHRHVGMVHQLAAPFTGRGKLVLARFGEDPLTGQKCPPLVRHFEIGDVADMAEAVRKLGAERDRNLYVPLAVMRPALRPGAKGFERDVLAVLGLVGDFDDEAAADYEARLPLPPDYVLETSPGRFQVFYLFDKPASVAEAKSVAETLQAAAGCDYGTKDLSHVWRIAGTLNWPMKRKLAAGRPREPVTVRVAAPWGGSLTSLAELREALEALEPAEEPEPKAEARPNGRAKPNGAFDVARAVAGLPGRLRERITAAVTPEEDRSNRLRFAVGALVERGFSDAEIEAIVRAYPEGVGNKYVGRPDLGKEISRIRGKTSTTKVRPAEASTAGQATAQSGRRQLALGSDVEIARRVAADLRERFGAILYADGEVYRWEGARWGAIPEEEIRLAAHEYDGALYPSPGGEPVPVRLNKARIDSIISELRPGITRRDFFADAPAGINCTSGFIRFDENFEPRLEPHSRAHRQRHVLAGRWGSGVPFELPADSLLHKLLHGCFKGDEDADNKINLLQGIAGVVVTGRATKLRKPKAVILKGDQAENGKSQILDMLRALVPKGASTAISPRHFSDGRYIVKLVGKLLNAPDELGGEAIAGEEFKKAVTGNEIVARDVYKSSVEFKPTAQHVCATNLLPPFKGGMDRGVRRRLLVLEFKRVIPEEERIEDIGARIGEEEPDLLLAWAIEGAKRVLSRRAYAEPESSRKALADWVLGADMVLAWLEDEEEIDYGGFKPEIQGNFNPVRTRDAYAEFRRWAEDEERQDPRKIPDINGFTQRVTAAGKKGVGFKRTSSGRFFTGLVLKKCRRFRSCSTGGAEARG